MSKNKKNNLQVEKKANNDSKELASTELNTAEKLVSSVLSEKKVDDPRAKYFLFRILGLPPQIAAKACDYHPDYGYKLDKKFRNDQKLRSLVKRITGAIPEQYKALCKLRLVDIAEIEMKALAEYKENSLLAIEKPQLLKQIKQGAGVLLDEDARPVNLVNIVAIQQHMKEIHEQKVQSQATDIDVKPSQPDWK